MMNASSRNSALLGLLLCAAPAAGFDQTSPFELRWSPGEIRMTELANHAGDLKSVVPFPDGKRLLTADDYSIRVWSLENQAPLLVVRPDDLITAAILSADGKTIVSAEGKGEIHLRDAATGRELKTVATGNYIDKLALASDGRRLTTYWTGEAKVVDLETGEVVKTWDLKAPGNGPGDDYIPDCVAVTPDGRALAALTKKKLRVYDLETGAITSSWSEKRASDVYECALVLSPDAKSVLVKHAGETLLLRDLADGKERASFKTARGHSLRGAAFAAGGRRVVAGTTEGLWSWDAATGKPTVVWARGGYVDQPVLSTDGERIFSRVPGGRISIVDSHTGAAVGAWPRCSEYDTISVIDKDGKPALKGVGYALDSAEEFNTAGIDDRTLPLFSKLFKTCSTGSDRGFDLMASCFKALRAQAVEAEPVPPPPADLAQGAYESTAAFNARVSAAKASYEKVLAEREKRLADWKPPEAALPVSFLMIFGNPKVENTVYDPDTRLFTFDIAAGNHEASGFRVRMGFKEQIPNDKAEEFEKRLRDAAPTVAFLVQGGNFSLEKVSVLLPGWQYERYHAVPTDAVAARQLARVSIADGLAKPADPAALDVSFGFSQSADLAAKKRELADARKKQATAAELSALEEAILRISDAGTQYNSDVDAPVAARAEDPDAYAVVVGVESYQMKDLPKARFAERDARSVAKRLEALGVPPRNMKVLIGADATRAKLAGVLEDWLPQRVGDGSKVYFYFSGHGAPEAASGDAYLVPWDGDPSLLKRTGYLVSSLYADLGKLRGSRRVAILDACFSGAGGRSLLAKGARPLVNSRGADSGNVTVLAAASASQITASLEAEGHGLFTYHFLKSLGAGGRPASAVFAELKPKVQDDAARQSREQTPAFQGPDAAIP
jgi:hypothetical protein